MNSPGARALGSRPRDRPVERPVELERAGPVADSESSRLRYECDSRSPQIRASSRGETSASTTSACGSVVDGARKVRSRRRAPAGARRVRPRAAGSRRAETASPPRGPASAARGRSRRSAGARAAASSDQQWPANQPRVRSSAKRLSASGPRGRQGRAQRRDEPARPEAGAHVERAPRRHRQRPDQHVPNLAPGARRAAPPAAGRRRRRARAPRRWRVRRARAATHSRRRTGERRACPADRYSTSSSSLAEEGRAEPERVDRGADVVHEAR